MPKSNALSNDYIARLQNAIRQLNDCESKFVETVVVSESLHGFENNIDWHGEVAIFEICGHPEAKRAYAWSMPANKQTSYVVVLEIPPVNSPQTAVQAAIAAQIVNRTFRS